MIKAERTIIIDEEGFFVMDEKRISDEEVGAMLLENLRRKERGTFSTIWDDEEIFLEAFDEPLVVQSLSVIEDDLLPPPEGSASAAKAQGPSIKLVFPYDVRAALRFETLSVDDWDRFHGRTDQGIPYVFSRKAQAQFFNLLEEFDDESITWNGVQYDIPVWLDSEAHVSSEDFWSGKYRNQQDGWDLGEANSILADMLPRLKLPKSRILVPGAGRSHDAALFAEAGHLVTAVDISDEAIAEAKKLYGHLPNLSWVKADVFKMPESFTGNFDMLFEHTCYCAVEPKRRAELIRAYTRTLTPSGQLMGVFMVADRPHGPPFGSTEWEIRERLKKAYEFQFWARWKKSQQRRKSMELYVLARKLRGNF